MAEIRVVHIDPPQPGGIIDPISGRVCGKPATAGTVESARLGPAGYLLVLPICQECVRAMQQLYPPHANHN